MVIRGKPDAVRTLLRGFVLGELGADLDLGILRHTRSTPIERGERWDTNPTSERVNRWRSSEGEAVCAPNGWRNHAELGKVMQTSLQRNCATACYG
jgi:hypothetical protein